MKKILHITDGIFMLMIFIYAAVFCVPFLFQLIPVRVLSGSMEPAVKTGSIAYIRKMSAADIEKGDVIAFRVKNGELVLHRAVDVSQAGEFTTKGDANENEDFGIVTPRQVVGKYVFQIPYVEILYGCIVRKRTIGICICYLIFTSVLKISSRKLPRSLGEGEIQSGRA